MSTLDATSRNRGTTERHPQGDDAAAVVTGLGVLSPLGSSRAQILHRISAGEHAATSAELGGAGAYVDSIPLDAVPEGNRSRIGRLDRFCQLVLSAAHLALRDAALDLSRYDPERVALSVGTGLGCLLTDEEYYRRVVESGARAASPRLFAYTVSSAAAGELSIALGIKGPNVTSHMGFAAGAGALGYGFDLLQLGKADVVLAVGADALGPALVDALRDMRLLKSAAESRPFLDRIGGVFPAEAAAAVVLERADRAAARGASALVRVEGHAGGFEPTLTSRERSCQGPLAAIRRALAASRRAPGDVGLVMSSAAGTPLDQTEAAAFAGALEEHTGCLVMASKPALGETFAAAAMLDVALAVALWEERLPKPIPAGLSFDVRGSPLSSADTRRRIDGSNVALIHSLCYSGNVATLVLSRCA